MSPDGSRSASGRGSLAVSELYEDTQDGFAGSTAVSAASTGASSAVEAMSSPSDPSLAPSLRFIDTRTRLGRLPTPAESRQRRDKKLFRPVHAARSRVARSSVLHAFRTPVADERTQRAANQLERDPPCRTRLERRRQCRAQSPFVGRKRPLFDDPRGFLPSLENWGIPRTL